MVKLNLNQIAQFSEIIAATAVVISLIYVGRQVQDNTAAVRSASAQAVANASDSALTDLVSNPEFSAMRRKGTTDYATLTETERYRYVIFTRGTWIRMQNVYIQYDIGVLDRRLWGTYARVICENFGSQGMQATWEFHTPVLDPEFVGFVENCPESASSIDN